MRKHSTKKVAKPMNETEAKAKEIALAYERNRIETLMGKDAASLVREVGEGGGYEIVSPDGRTIEVKGAKGVKPNYGFVINSEQEERHLKSGGYIYRIIGPMFVYGKGWNTKSFPILTTWPNHSLPADYPVAWRV